MYVFNVFKINVFKINTTNIIQYVLNFRDHKLNF